MATRVPYRSVVFQAGGARKAGRCMKDMNQGSRSGRLLDAIAGASQLEKNPRTSCQKFLKNSVVLRKIPS